MTDWLEENGPPYLFDDGRVEFMDSLSEEQIVGLIDMTIFFVKSSDDMQEVFNTLVDYLNKRHEKFVSVVSMAIQHKSVEVRREVVTWMLDIGDFDQNAAERFWSTSLNDPDETVRQEARETLQFQIDDIHERGSDERWYLQFEPHLSPKSYD